MKWNWQKPEWPHFFWDADALSEQEAQFLRQADIVDALKHLEEDQKSNLIIELIETPMAEVQVSFLQNALRQKFGLMPHHNPRTQMTELGIADMMFDVYQTWEEPLDHKKLFNWHMMVMMGQGQENAMHDFGRYRTNKDRTIVMSNEGTVCFEAPRSTDVSTEMDQFIVWFNNSAPGGKNPLPPLTRAGLAHLHFVSIHPFEEGNGRIGRTISDKALSQGLGGMVLLALFQTIHRKRNDDYDVLAQSNKDMNASAWLEYFAKTVLYAQKYALSMIELPETKLHQARILKEGSDAY